MIILAALCAAGTAWAIGLLVVRRIADNNGHSAPTRKSKGLVLAFDVWLRQAGAGVSPLQFIMVSVLVASCAFVCSVAIAKTPDLSVLPAVAAGCGPLVYWKNRRRRAVTAVGAAWPDAIRHLVGVLGTGTSTLHDALEDLARSGPVPLRPYMMRYAYLSNRIGDRPALETLRDELSDAVSDPVLIALAGAVREGTDTVLRVLADLAEQIAADLQLLEKVRTLQSQSRIANWGCFVIPYGVLFMLCTTNPAYREFFSRPVGVLLLLAGVLVSLSGLYLSQRLIAPVHPVGRVFAGRGPVVTNR